MYVIVSCLCVCDFLGLKAGVLRWFADNSFALYTHSVTDFPAADFSVCLGIDAIGCVVPQGPCSLANGISVSTICFGGKNVQDTLPLGISVLPPVVTVDS